MRKFSKILKNFLRKWQKCIILAYSQKTLKSPGYLFGRTIQIAGEILEHFEIFYKNSIEKLKFYLFLERLWLKVEPS